MAGLLNELSQWAKTLPYWEQAALDKVVNKGSAAFTDSDYEELTQYLIEDANGQSPTQTRPAIQFSQNDGQESDGQPLLLLEITNLQNVNALATGQTLSFGEGLTVLFGANGSGKSGYARLLGCASFSRGDREVLPDVSRPPGPPVSPSADILVLDGEGEKTIHYQADTQCRELSSIYVFDSTSVQIHLTKENNLSFSPHGLSYLTLLSEVTDRCRERLKDKLRPFLGSHCFGPIFHGDSEVSRLIAVLDTKPELKVLEKLANVTPEEKLRLEALTVEIAKLISEDIPKKVAHLEGTISDLLLLISRLRSIESGVSDRILREINDALRITRDRQDAALSMSVDRFKAEFFKQTGGNVWRRFIEAAKALADAEQPSGSYPIVGDRCLLCHETITQSSHDLIHGLWAFLKGEAQAELKAALDDLEAKRKALAKVELDCFNDQFVSYRHLLEEDVGLMHRVSAYIEASRRRRDDGVNAIKTHAEIPIEPLPDNCVADIEAVIVRLKDRLEEVRLKNREAERATLENELLLLTHRVLLSENLPAIREQVQKRQWATKAEKAAGSTNHITKKYNELFKSLVTERYIEKFKQILRELNCPLEVQVKTRGSKGKTLKQIVLSNVPSAAGSKATPDKVLSEGEKRAVALADFLTEVSLDAGSHAIVLDDPVTSLDFDWKETVARRLVAEAVKRQVILFTHDMHFLYLVNKFAEQESLDLVYHNIRREGANGKPGYIYSDISPMTEKSNRKPTKAEYYLKRAQETNSPQDQEDKLQAGFGALRTTYEAFVAFDLLGGVVQRFEHQISVGRLKEIVADHDLFNKVIDKYALLSRYIHLQSDLGAPAPPTPEMLKAEITDFYEIRKAFKDKKKAMGV
jgi:ABC-type lipoprotein export system ATPase subunit